MIEKAAERRVISIREVAAKTPLTAIKGMSEARARRLAGVGIDSIEKLAGAAPKDVAKVLGGVSVKQASDFIKRAKRSLPSATEL